VDGKLAFGVRQPQLPLLYVRARAVAYESGSCGYRTPNYPALFRGNVQVIMKYRVVMYPSDEGFAVACPDLPGCWSQGATEEEALTNIREAIEDYMAVVTSYP
jgi:predicted RNase H-like HicB family nuclease